MLSLARLISFVTNPIFLVFPIPFLLVYRETSDTLYAFKWMVFSTLFIFLVGLFVLYEVRRQMFSDMDVSKREQRPLLFAFVLFIATLYLISIFLLRGPMILYAAVGGILGSVLVLALVNRRIKASIHVATVSSFFCVIAILYGGVNFLWLLLIPLVAWARVRSRRHTVSETLVGCIMGIVLTLGVYIVVKTIEFLVT